MVARQITPLLFALSAMFAAALFFVEPALQPEPHASATTAQPDPQGAEAGGQSTPSLDLSRSQRQDIAQDSGLMEASPLTDTFIFPSTIQGKRFGIDVSHYSGNVDWAAAAKAGVPTVYIKATQGTNVTDSKFAENWKGATAAGIRAGAYHFLSSLSDPTAQAEHFLSVYSKDIRSADDLPPVLDVEWDFSPKSASGQQSDRWSSKSPDEIVTAIKAWTDRVAQDLPDDTPIRIYTATRWWTTRIKDAGNDLAEKHLLWISDYTSQDLKNGTPTVPEGFKPVAWQFTDKGTVPGISPSVDVSEILGEPSAD